MALTVMVEVCVEVLLGPKLVRELLGLELDKRPSHADSCVDLLHIFGSRENNYKILELAKFYNSIRANSRNCGNIHFNGLD